MATMTEILPDRKAGRKTIRWTPAEGDFEFHGMPVAGTVVVEGKRKGDSCEYIVCEFASPWPGRAFSLVKLGTGGSDPTQSHYSVFCSKDGAEADSCDCAGNTFQGRCKHRDCLRALLANGWV